MSVDVLNELHEQVRVQPHSYVRDLHGRAADEIARLRAALDAAETRAQEATLQSLAAQGQSAEAHDARLKAEAERDAARATALEDALAAIAALPTGKSEDVMEGQEQAYDAIRAMKDADEMSDVIDYCAKCGDPRNAHHRRHPFVSGGISGNNRHDAPLTPAEAMRCPEVAALVKAAYIASGSAKGRAFDVLDAALAPFTKGSDG